MPDDALAVFEQNAGFLMVEDSVLAHIEEAKRFGAVFRTDEPVTSWSCPNGDSVIVKSVHDEYHARRLIITAGAWAASLLSELRIPLQVQRKHLHWFATTSDVYQQRDTPVFFFELAERSFFYGFPQLDQRGVKMAEHGHGEAVDDPANLNREVDASERARVESFLASHLPDVSLQPTRHCVCMYTMTPDEHFIVDRHPHYPQVALAAGLSGHGFKFTPVLGAALADLVLDGTTELPIGFLSCQRFS